MMKIKTPAFRNNYPEAILLTILILFSAASQAQLRDGLYHTPITPAYSWKSGWFKTNLSIPTVLATSGIDTGSVYYRLTDSTIQVYTGSQWLTIGSGGGSTDTTSLSNRINAKVDTARTLTINGVTYSLGANRTWSLDLQSVTSVGSYTTTNIRSSLGFYVRNSTNTQTLIALDNNSDSHGELVISNGPSTIYSRLRHDYLTFSNSGFTHKIKPPASITADVDFTTPNIASSRTIPVSVTINGSTTYANTTTGDIDLGTISSATVLNNVGTGFDVAVQGTDGVKRLQGDWGITLDSATSNVVKIKADSSEVASIAQVQHRIDSLAATISVGGTSVDSSAKYLGTIYNGSSFSAVTPLLTDGATVVASGGNLNFSGGANNYTQTVNYDQYTALDRWFIKDSIIATEKTGTSYGFGLGVRSYSTSQLVGIVATFNMTNDANSGKITISTLNAGTPTVKATSSALSWSAGDTISLSFERNRFVFTATVRNITTNSAPITVTYNYVYTTNDGVPNTGRFAIFSLGGNFSVVKHRISSRASKYAKALFVGDSKTTGQFGDNSDVNWPVKLEATAFNPIVIDAGPSDQLLDMINKVPEIALLEPKAVVMTAPSNDIRGAYNADTITNRYDRFVTQVEALGIPVYHMLGFYEPGINQLPLIAHIRATYPGNRIIDTYTPTTQSGLLNADNIHPNQAMNEIIVTTVANSFILPNARVPYYTLPANTFLPYSTKSTIDTTNGTMSLGGLVLNDHAQGTDLATFKVRRGTKYWAFVRNGADVANSFSMGDTTGTGNFRIYNTTTQTQIGISAATGTLAFVTNNTNRYTISNAGAHALTGTTYTFNGSTITNTLTGATVFSSSAANNVFGVTNSVATNLHRFYVSNNGSLGLILSQNGSSPELTGAAQGDMNIRAFTSGNDKRLFVAVGSSSAPAMTFHPTQEVNIGSSLTRDASAKLRIESTTQGFLPPKMTGAQAEAIASPTEGLMVYATDGSGTTITSKGWWGYDGSTWVKLN